MTLSSLTRSSTSTNLESRPLDGTRTPGTTSNISSHRTLVESEKIEQKARPSRKPTWLSRARKKVASIIRSIAGVASRSGKELVGKGSRGAPDSRLAPGTSGVRVERERGLQEKEEASLNRQPREPVEQDVQGPTEKCTNDLALRCRSLDCARVQHVQSRGIPCGPECISANLEAVRMSAGRAENPMELGRKVRFRRALKSSSLRRLSYIHKWLETSQGCLGRGEEALVQHIPQSDERDNVRVRVKVTDNNLESRREDGWEGVRSAGQCIQLTSRSPEDCLLVNYMARGDVGETNTEPNRFAIVAKEVRDLMIGYQVSVSQASSKIEALRSLLLQGSTQPLRAQMLGLVGEDAQYWLDALQMVLDSDPFNSQGNRGWFLQALLRLSIASKSYPRCLQFSHQVHMDGCLIDSGAYGDVYRGDVVKRKVALKVFKLYQTTNITAFMEVQSIPHIHCLNPHCLRPVPGYMEGGYSVVPIEPRKRTSLLRTAPPSRRPREIGIVSPWMESGNVVQYLKDGTHAGAQRLLLISDIAAGLAYLHDNNVVHGDLKGANILVSKAGRACLADFGLSKLSGLAVEGWTSQQRSLGRLVIMTEKFPFHQSNEIGVLFKLMNGERPEKPAQDEPPFQAFGLTDAIWAFIETCWAENPDARPTARDVQRHPLLRGLVDPRPQQQWGGEKLGEAAASEFRRLAVPASESPIEASRTPSGAPGTVRPRPCKPATLLPHLDSMCDDGAAIQPRRSRFSVRYEGAFGKEFPGAFHTYFPTLITTVWDTPLFPNPNPCGQSAATLLLARQTIRVYSTSRHLLPSHLAELIYPHTHTPAPLSPGSAFDWVQSRSMLRRASSRVSRKGRKASGDDTHASNIANGLSQENGHGMTSSVSTIDGSEETRPTRRKGIWTSMRSLTQSPAGKSRQRPQDASSDTSTGYEQPFSHALESTIASDVPIFPNNRPHPIPSHGTGSLRSLRSAFLSSFDNLVPRRGSPGPGSRTPYFAPRPSFHSVVQLVGSQVELDREPEPHRAGRSLSRASSFHSDYSQRSTGSKDELAVEGGWQAVSFQVGVVQPTRPCEPDGLMAADNLDGEVGTRSASGSDEVVAHEPNAPSDDQGSPAPDNVHQASSLHCLPEGQDNQAASALCAHLLEACSNKESYRQVLALEGIEGQKWLDAVQVVSLSSRSAYIPVVFTPPSPKVLDSDTLGVASHDRGRLLQALIRLSRKSGLHPQRLLLSHEVEKTSEVPVAEGAFGEVYEGAVVGRKVAIKIFRMNQRTDLVKLTKAISKEAIMWCNLHHPNLLPCYGVNIPDTHQSHRIGLVSPWMASGNIVQYLSERRDANRLLLLSDIASGMAYLHENKIVHGDLKGANILVSASGRACLADFGLSALSDPDLLSWTSIRTATAYSTGTARWQAPELLIPIEDVAAKATANSDVYSYG
ncbi:hypothetical protein NMY22_g14279 [Coprinellus aureogranulatus]|nr:hypothetical protein NMY22_g14279 [Coprinellus aureogranulatus]